MSKRKPVDTQASRKAKPRESKELREYKRTERIAQQIYQDLRSGKLRPVRDEEPKRNMPKDLERYIARENKRRLREEIAINAA